MRMGEELSLQMPSYESDTEYKANALKQLGLILQKLNHKDFIRKKLDLMFTTANHGSDVERMGCAQGFGYCAATHLDLALEVVQEQLKPKAQEKKSSGFFSSLFSSEPSGPPADVVRTAMLCFGYITAYGPTKLITSRLEVTILASMRPILERKNNSIPMFETLIQVIDLIGKSVHPSHLKVDQFIFKPRDELLRHIINFITSLPAAKSKVEASSFLQLRILGLNACTTLLALEPALADNLEAEIVTKTIKFYDFAGKEVAAGEAPSSSSSSPPTPTAEEESADDSSATASTKILIQNFNRLLASILYMNTTLPCFVRLFTIVQDYVKHKDVAIRRQAITTSFFLLEKFVEYLSTGARPFVDEKFVHLGKCLSSVIPRVTDSQRIVRIAALQCTQYLLFVDHIIQTGIPERPKSEDGEETFAQIDMPDHLQGLSEMVGRVESDDLPSQFSAANEMASVVCDSLAEDELCHLLMHLLSGLTDADSSASSGTCIVLNSIIKIRGDQFLSQVSDLITGMLNAMEKVTHEKTINGTLHSIRTLARHHPLPVIDALVNMPLPHSSHVVTSIQAISKDPELLEILLDHILDVLNNSQCVIDSGNAKAASNESLSATCALGYLFLVIPSSYLVEDRFAAFLGTLMLRFGTTAKLGAPKPRKDLYDCWATFAKQIGNEKLEQLLKDQQASLLSDTDYPSGLSQVVACVCNSYPDEMPKLYNFLLPYLKGNFKGQRLVVVTVYSELMNWSKNEAILQNVINALLVSMNDEDLRLQSIIGIGNSAASGPELVNQFAPSVIDALMSMIDNKDENISMESMNGLDKVFQLVDSAKVQPILINIIHRIRPHLEKPNPKIRAASFSLFGTLARFGHGVAAALFKEQMHSTLPSVIIHLTDPDRNVQIACKAGVRKLVPLLGAADLDDLIGRKWFDPSIRLPFEQFSDEFAKRFVKNFPELVPNYVMASIEFFQSNWHQLRSSAATLAGYFLGYLPADRRGTLNAGIVTTAFITLLSSQKEASVREATASAMRLLYDY